jgi:hypothetical protein
MTDTFVFKAHGWKYEMSQPNANTGQAVLTVESQIHDDDPGAGSNLVKSALYHVCDMLEVTPASEIEHSGGWAQCLIQPDSIEDSE